MYKKVTKLLLSFLKIESPIEIIKELNNIEAIEEDTVEFTCELSKPNKLNGVWKKDNDVITASAKFKITTDEQTQSLTISSVTLDDFGSYTYSIERVSTEGRLVVEGT